MGKARRRLEVTGVAWRGDARRPDGDLGKLHGQHRARRPRRHPRGSPLAGRDCAFSRRVRLVAPLQSIDSRSLGRIPAAEALPQPLCRHRGARASPLVPAL